jgi:hypothetical protein
MRVPLVTLFVSVLAFFVLASVGCSKKIDPSKVSSITNVDKPELRLTLPGAWHEVPTDHGYELRNVDGSRQVIASTLATPPTPLADRRPTIETLVTIRRNVMGGLGDGGAQVGDAIYETNGDRLVARFHGVDPVHDAFASFFLVATETAVVTVAYYEYRRANEIEAEARAQSVFATVVAK